MVFFLFEDGLLVIRKKMVHKVSNHLLGVRTPENRRMQNWDSSIHENSTRSARLRWLYWPVCTSCLTTSNQLRGPLTKIIELFWANTSETTTYLANSSSHLTSPISQNILGNVQVGINLINQLRILYHSATRWCKMHAGTLWNPNSPTEINAQNIQYLIK